MYFLKKKMLASIRRKDWVWGKSRCEETSQKVIVVVSVRVMVPWALLITMVIEIWRNDLFQGYLGNKIHRIN